MEREADLLYQDPDQFFDFRLFGQVMIEEDFLDLGSRESSLDAEGQGICLFGEAEDAPLVIEHVGQPATADDGEGSIGESTSQMNEKDPAFDLQTDQAAQDNLQLLSSSAFLTYRYMDRILSKPSCLMHLSAVWNEAIEQMFKHYLKLDKSATAIQIAQGIDALRHKPTRLDEQLRHVYMRFTSYLLEQSGSWQQETEGLLCPAKPQVKKERLLNCYTSLFGLSILACSRPVLASRASSRTVLSR